MPLPKANINTNIMGAASRSRATLYVVLENFRSKTGSFENLGPKQGPKTGFCDFLLKQGPKQGQKNSEKNPKTGSKTGSRENFAFQNRVIRNEGEICFAHYMP